MPMIDRLFVNGRVWTADAAQPQAEALALACDTIVAVGSTAQMRALAPAGVEVIDLEGRRVLPGFIDAHWHLLAGSAATFYMADSLDEFQRRLRALAVAEPGKGWIVDSGWAYTDFPDGVPHRRWIDAVVNDRPVWIAGRDGHMVLGNTLALQALEIADASGASTNTSVVRDAQGALTGELRGMDELERFKTLLPVATAAQVERLLRQVQAQANAFGVTSVHNLDENFGVDLAVFQHARAEGWLSLRVRQAHRLLPEPGAERLALLDERRRATAGDAMFSFAGLKGWLDGTIDARTAYMREPLTDGSTGAPYWDAHQLNAAVATMDRHGWQVMLHATGDGSIGQALDAFENAARVNGVRDRRHRIEHIDIPTAGDLARCARAGVVASPQPNFAYPDDTVVHNYSGLLGPERTALAQSFRAIDEAGVRQCFSSDYPVSSMDVLRSVHTAVARTRRDRAGAAPWTPHERIGVEAALRHFTADAAYAEFDEHRTGRLAPGLLADMVVLSDDIFDDPARDLLGSHVLMTILGGRIVHETTRTAAATRAQAAAQAGTPLLRPRSACPTCRGASLDPRLLATRAVNRDRWHRHA